MNAPQNLEPSVVAEIQKGKKISAIKELRRLRGIGLKEAKIFVDEYCKVHDVKSSAVEKVGSGGVLNLIVLIALAAVIYLIFFKS